MAKKNQRGGSYKPRGTPFQPRPQVRLPPARPVVPSWTVIDALRPGAAPANALDADLTSDDNAGVVAWRQRDRPLNTITIPDELLFVGQEQEYERIARAHNTHVFPLEPREPRPGREASTSKVFGIWGEPGPVAVAASALNDWIMREKDSKNAAGMSKFDRLQSFSASERRRAERKWQQEVQKHRFRQAPPEGTSFQMIGLFRWPDDMPIEENFGRTLEALDTMRLERACYIVLREDKKTIEIMGDEGDVRLIIQGLRFAIYQLVAKQVRGTARYLLDDFYGMPDSIAIKRYDHPEVIDGPAKAPGKLYRGLDWQSSITSGLGGQLLSQMMHTIDQLRYLQGYVTFCIRLGLFLAVQHMEPEDEDAYTPDEFSTMLLQSQFVGQTTDEIDNFDAECAALDNLTRAHRLLSPYSAMDAKLSDTRPEYSATLDFAEGVRLIMTWQDQKEADSTMAQITPCGRRWLRREVDTLPVQQINTHLINLRNGSAWHFDMQSHASIEEARVPQHLLRVADRVKIDEDAIRNFDMQKPFVTLTGTKSLRSLRLQSSRRYRVNDSEYVLEWFKFQLYTYKWFAGSPARMSITKPRTGLSLYNMQWNAMLEENEKLAVGQGVTWAADKQAWFPAADGSADVALGHLLAILHDVAAVVRPPDDEEIVDNHTGMAIG